MAKLRVKNFGPIRDGFKENDGWFEIKKNTFFIGNQGSGKSTLAKLISTLFWLEKAIYRGDINKDSINSGEFHNMLRYHQIYEYFKEEEENTYIEFVGHKYHFVFDFSSFPKPIVELKSEGYSIPQIMYVPSERLLLSAIPNAFNIKGLPENLFSFAEELRNAQKYYQEKSLELPFGRELLKFDEEEDEFFLHGSGYNIRLSEASSGFQSLVPLYIVSKYLMSVINEKQNKNHLTVSQSLRMNDEISSIIKNKELSKEEMELELEKITAKYYPNYFINIVEEPELNLFPDSQWKVLESLIGFNNEMDDNKLIITTHSPFIINFLPIAVKSYSLKQKTGKDKKLQSKLNEIYPLSSSINPDDLVVYELDENKGTVNKLNDYKGLPSDDNYLNNKLGYINDTFTNLLEIEDKWM